MKKFFSCLLVLALVLSLSACGKKADTEITVAKINDTVITRADALPILDATIAQASMIYSQYYGTELNTKDTSFVSEMKSEVIDLLCNQEILKQKLQAEGLWFTEEELADIDTTVQEEYQSYVDSIISSYSLPEEEASKVVDSYGYTHDMLSFFAVHEASIERAHQLTDPQAVVTDEMLNTEYTAQLDAAKQKYADDVNAFISDALNGSTIYCYPEGYRAVEIITIPFSEEVTNQVSELQSMLYNDIYYAYSYNTMMNEEGIDDETAANYQSMIDGFNEEYNTLAVQLNDLTVASLEGIREAADAMLVRAQADGADFKALNAELNNAEADVCSIPEGFPYHNDNTIYDGAIREAINALTEPGQVSELIGTSNGYHIVRYVCDLEAHDVPFEELTDALTESLQSSLLDTVYQEQFDQWEAEAAIETYISKL